VQRVLDAVKDLGYESSLVASSMRARRTGVVGVLLADFEPFSAEILKGVGAAMHDTGFDLLAYAGSVRGHVSVAQAVADDTCRQWLQQWWSTASRHLDQPEAELAAYQKALLERFANPRMQHQLAQIGADGSQKLPIRILPVLRAERAQGRMPVGATLVLAAWICYLRGLGAPVSDVRAATVVPLADGRLPDAVRRVLHDLDAKLSDDAEVVDVVRQQCEQLKQQAAA
jgi:fructuronate reductase